MFFKIPVRTRFIRLYSAATAKSEVKDSIQHAVVSVFDLFSIGIGPSSSHTVGPMRAAKIFIEDLVSIGQVEKVVSLRVDLYGSLALTGVGHGTPNAILMGLEGETPEGVNPKSILGRVDVMKSLNRLKLNGRHEILFNPEKHLIYHYTKCLEAHPNGMRFSAYDKAGEIIATNEFFSIGGGFVIKDAVKDQEDTPSHDTAQNIYYLDPRTDHQNKMVPTDSSHSLAEEMSKGFVEPKVDRSPLTRTESKGITAALPFHNAESLVHICETKNISIAQVVFQNELQWRSAEEITARTLHLWNVMNESINSGIDAPIEYLPGGLMVKRRAPSLHAKLMHGLANYAGLGASPGSGQTTPKVNRQLASTTEALIRPQRSLPALDWISLYAIAVNEQNASGGRVVTSPTNGAAGIIPAVLKYYLEFICPSPQQRDHDTVEFLLTAAAICMLYKRGASISAAEMGCQGETGVACSAAAGALAAVMGGCVGRIENAAEIAMEHSLGLTCDPPLGLVIIPCIERNALGAVKAVTSAQLALNGDGTHRVSLDQVIATMRQTGIDMQSKYKETSQGGLAVNVPVC